MPPRGRGRKHKGEPATTEASNNPPPARKAPTSMSNHNKTMVAQSKEPEEGFDRATLFTKTKMCKFHLVGLCAKGSGCMYAHDPTDLNDLPDLYRTKLCKSLIRTGQCNDPNCQYAHNKDELRSTSQLRKTKMCKFWLEGRCELGESCSYAHDPAELHQTPYVSAAKAVVKEAPVQMKVGFAQQRAQQRAEAIPISLASGGYAANPQMALHEAHMQQIRPPSSEDVPSMGEEPRQVMVVDAKTGKALAAGTMKSGDLTGSVRVNPYTIDAGTSSAAQSWNTIMGTQQEFYSGPGSPSMSHQMQKERHDAVSTLNPVKIATSSFWPPQQNHGLSAAPLRKVPSVGDHRSQPAALGQPKTVSDSPLRGAIAGSPLRSPELHPLSTPELMGASAPHEFWGGSDPMYASQLPVQLEQMSGGDWVVRNTFLEMEDEPRNYPMRPVASCMGRFESLAHFGSSNSLNASSDY